MILTSFATFLTFTTPWLKAVISLKIKHLITIFFKAEIQTFIYYAKDILSLIFAHISSIITYINFNFNTNSDYDI